MIVAVFSLKDTATLATPGTACRLALTMERHAAQSMFCTASVIVLSPAIAVGAAKTTATKTRWATSFFMLALRSRGEKEGGDEVEAQRGDDEDRC